MALPGLQGLELLLALGLAAIALREALGQVAVVRVEDGDDEHRRRAQANAQADECVFHDACLH